METTEATEWTPAEDFDTGLTADDWKEILEDDDFIRTHPVGLITLWLYYKNNYPFSYTELEQKYMLYGGFCSAGMTQFSTGIDSKFKEKINQFTDETGKYVYWYLPFKRKKSVKNFIYKLRKEVREGFDKLSEECRQKFEQLETSLFFTAKFFRFLKEHYGWQDLHKSKIAFKNNPLICIFKDKWSLRMYERWSSNIPYLLLHEGGNGIHSSDKNVLNLALDLTLNNGKFSWNPARQNRSNKQNKEISFPTFENSDQNDVFKQLAQLISQRTLETMNNSKEKECLEKLQKSRQIILTGAPGTGKSYAAREIANRLTGNKAENIDFVQFHPSMDYTDFVEGLRPIKDDKGQIGFERQDGIFKAFCKKALDNWLNYQKTPEQQTKERNLKQQLDNFLNDAIENETEFRLLRGTPFEITGFDENKIFVTASWKERNLEIKIPYKNVLDVLVKDLPLNNIASVIGYFERKKQWQCDSYTFALCNEIRKRISENEPQTSVSDQKEELENFVFIIDEINRGDISKIFGELFFAIDPSYRGKKGKITTQYQNLVESDDLYADGFYIPENVYIIGTMNDIDRGVESMDFAIRRRFTWIEVNPDDTQSMLDSGIPKYAADAKERMGALNKVIFTNPSLGKAYQIGAAYFLRLNELNGNFDALWAYHLEPLLREYLRGDPRAEEFLDEMKKAYGVEAE